MVSQNRVQVEESRRAKEALKEREKEHALSKEQKQEQCELQATLKKQLEEINLAAKKAGAGVHLPARRSGVFKQRGLTWAPARAGRCCGQACRPGSAARHC